MMRQLFRIAGVTGIAITLTACLQKETTHTLYLSPEGDVVWAALEKDVHSDENTTEARRVEEDDYLVAASAGAHGVGRGLAGLDPTRIRTTVLRSERPFMVMTEARFPSIDQMFERVLSEMRIPGYASLTREGTRRTLTVHADLGSAPDQDETGAVAELFEEVGQYRIVLTSGRFVAATGFRLLNDGVIAVPVEITEERAAAGRVFDLTLTWHVPRGTWP